MLSSYLDNSDNNLTKAQKVNSKNTPVKNSNNTNFENFKTVTIRISRPLANDLLARSITTGKSQISHVNRALELYLNKTNSDNKSNHTSKYAPYDLDYLEEILSPIATRIIRHPNDLLMEIVDPWVENFHKEGLRLYKSFKAKKALHKRNPSNLNKGVKNEDDN